jgi:cysteine sulfinate desulfinase/cysteine desulfurase-like protein
LIDHVWSAASFRRIDLNIVVSNGSACSAGSQRLSHG